MRGGRSDPLRVIALARDEGIEVVERPIRPEELAQATGAFLTGTAKSV